MILTIHKVKKTNGKNIIKSSDKKKEEKIVISTAMILHFLNNFG